MLIYKLQFWIHAIDLIFYYILQIYTSGENWYYAVAVAKEQDPDTDLTYLKGKNLNYTKSNLLMIFYCGKLYHPSITWSESCMWSPAYNSTTFLGLSLNKKKCRLSCLSSHSHRTLNDSQFSGKNTCHTGISKAAGWIYPLAYLISNGWMRYVYSQN